MKGQLWHLGAGSLQLIGRLENGLVPAAAAAGRKCPGLHSDQQLP